MQTTVNSIFCERLGASADISRVRSVRHAEICPRFRAACAGTRSRRVCCTLLVTLVTTQLPEQQVLT